MTEAIHTRRDRHVRSAAMELAGATTDCATRIVQELERTVRAPRSATTALSWITKPVGVSVLRDGMALTVQSVVSITIKGVVAAGLRSCVMPRKKDTRTPRRWLNGIALLCEVCVKETQTQQKVCVWRCVDPPQTLTMPQHRRCSSRATRRR